MPLTAIWNKSPESILTMKIDKIVAIAGDGKLSDNSECATEFRQFLREVDSKRLAEYAQHCLAVPFPKSGLVLQDVVNELGRRLEYAVTNGRYQGTSSIPGFDGVWHAPEGLEILIEVKTTDDFRISVESVAGYRDRLIAAGQLGLQSSMLIVVGKSNTGGLEAQIRGSRSAWDMRVISVDSLVRLVQLKENGEAETARRIRQILRPLEFTRLDGLIDTIFTVVRDAEVASVDVDVETKRAVAPSGWEFTDPGIIQARRESILSDLSRWLDCKLVKKSRACFVDPERRRRVVCTLSKAYDHPDGAQYWYAYHPAWDEFLADAEEGYFVVGGVDLAGAAAIPAAFMRAHLSSLNTTTKPDGGHYYHVKIIRDEENDLSMLLPKLGQQVSIKSFSVPMS